MVLGHGPGDEAHIWYSFFSHLTACLTLALLRFTRRPRSATTRAATSGEKQVPTLRPAAATGAGSDSRLLGAVDRFACGLGGIETIYWDQ